MSTILVTGGTGQLGTPTVAALVERGHDVRVLSRKPGQGHRVGDLATGAGLTEALDGIDTVVHLATTNRKDIGQTRNLLAAAKQSGVTHLVFISIVGIDKVGYPLYRDKLLSEEAIRDSGVPWTILRATQFHSFPSMLFRLRLPFIPVLPAPVQTIATQEVAVRLAELASGPAQGRVTDIGGPEIRSVRELAEEWNRAHGTHRPIWTLHLPGRTMKQYRAGGHLAGLPGYGTTTFAEYARREALDAQRDGRGAPRDDRDAGQEPDDH